MKYVEYISHFIGASLSEPHTSVTALRTHVCIYACLLGLTTYSKLYMSVFKYSTKIDIVKHVKASGGLLSECSVGDPELRRLKL